MIDSFPRRAAALRARPTAIASTQERRGPREAAVGAATDVERQPYSGQSRPRTRVAVAPALRRGSAVSLRRHGLSGGAMRGVLVSRCEASGKRGAIRNCRFLRGGVLSHLPLLAVGTEAAGGGARAGRSFPNRPATGQASERSAGVGGRRAAVRRSRAEGAHVRERAGDGGDDERESARAGGPVRRRSRQAARVAAGECGTVRFSLGRERVCVRRC